jgi:hypothetical protein
MIVNVFVKENVGKNKKVIETEVHAGSFEDAARVVMQTGVFNRETVDAEGSETPVTTLTYYPPFTIEKVVYEDHTIKKL